VKKTPISDYNQQKRDLLEKAKKARDGEDTDTKKADSAEEK